MHKFLSMWNMVTLPFTLIVAKTSLTPLCKHQILFKSAIVLGSVEIYGTGSQLVPALDLIYLVLN